MQKSHVEVTKEGKNLSVFLETSDGKNVRVVFDLLGRGGADDHGADPIKRAVAQVFGQPYDQEMQIVLNEHDIPADWLARKVEEVDRWLADYDSHHELD